jgi:hypothetical protein
MKNGAITLDKKISELNYKMKCYSATQENLELRRSTWKIKQCQDLYVRLVEFAGGFNVVRPGMRGRAKDIAITSYIKKIEPNYEKFKIDVGIANNKAKKFSNKEWLNNGIRYNL